MAKICGIENVAFVGKDGTEVRGKRIHFTEAIAADRGVGEAGDKIFLSAAKLAALAALEFAPTVGQHIEVLYDKNGRVKAVNVVDDPII